MKRSGTPENNAQSVLSLETDYSNRQVKPLDCVLLYIYISESMENIKNGTQIGEILQQEECVHEEPSTTDARNDYNCLREQLKFVHCPEVS